MSPTPGPRSPWSATAYNFVQHQLRGAANFWTQGRPAVFHLESLSGCRAVLNLKFQLPPSREILPPPSPYSTTPSPTSQINHPALLSHSSQSSKPQGPSKAPVKPQHCLPSSASPSALCFTEPPNPLPASFLHSQAPSQTPAHLPSPHPHPPAQSQYPSNYAGISGSRKIPTWCLRMTPSVASPLATDPQTLQPRVLLQRTLGRHPPELPPLSLSLKTLPLPREMHCLAFPP